MLAKNGFSPEYIATSRAAIRAQVTAFEQLAKATADNGDAEVSRRLEDLEHHYFAALTMTLENWFVHRQRSLEGKDGNALNEVRLLCTSMTTNGGRLIADKQITLDPATSVLGYAVGDPIALTATDFTRLADAFWAELERRYAEA